MQQQRPNAAKNKQINKSITLAAQLMTDYKREADKLVKEYRGYPGEKVSVAQSRVVARGAKKRHKNKFGEAKTVFKTKIFDPFTNLKTV